MVASIASKRRVSCHARGFAVERAPPTPLAQGNPGTPMDSRPKRHAEGRAGRLSRCREGNAGGCPGPLKELRAPSFPPPYEQRNAHAAPTPWVGNPRAALHDGRADERCRDAQICTGLGQL